MLIAASIHILSAMIWIGGLLFFYGVLNRAVEEVLEPTERLPLMHRIVQRFFPLFGWSMAATLASGFWLVQIAYNGGIGWMVELMIGLGAASVLLLGYLYYGPYRRMEKALDRYDLLLASSCLGNIRALTAANLLLGFVSVVIGVAARFPV